MSGPGEVTPRMALVCFAFGVASVPPGQPLSGPVLMRLLADLGLSESAARSLLLRMRRDGWLGSRRQGRQARYQLAPAVYSAQARIERQLRGQRPDWTGSFNGILYEVPERSRAFRDRLRRSAQFLGYTVLRPGLLLATSDRWEELVALMEPLPPGSQVLRTRLSFEDDDSRRLAAQLWGLDALAARYRRVLADSAARTQATEHQAPAGGPALAAFAAATLPVYEVAADDPDLPGELLPPDWPGDQLVAAIGRAHRAFGPSLRDYLAAVTRS